MLIGKRNLVMVIKMVLYPSLLNSSQMKIICVCFSSALLSFTSCTSSERYSSPVETPDGVGDTSSRAILVDKPSAKFDASQPDTLAFTTQPDFDADAVILSHDTLFVIATSLNVLYPFGQTAHAIDIRKNYPQFINDQGSEQANGQIYEYTIMRFKDSIIKFYDNEEDGATIVSGHITNPDLVLSNKIHTGMYLNQVINIFFSDINQSKIDNIRVLRIDYVVDNIKYFYIFKKKKLQTIDLDSYSIMSKSLQ
jgi:hypothetical protein